MSFFSGTYRTMLAMLTFAGSALIPCAVTAQTRPAKNQELEYRMNPNGTGFQEYGSEFCNRLHDDNQGTIWDSMHELPNTGNDNDKIWLRFDNKYDLRAGDILRFEVTFADKIDGNSEDKNNGCVTNFWMAVFADDWKGSDYRVSPTTDRGPGKKWVFYLTIPESYNNNNYKNIALHQDGGDGYKREINNNPEDTRNCMRISEFRVYYDNEPTIDLTRNYSLEEWKNLYRKDYENYQYEHTHGWVEQKYGRINVSDGTFLNTDGDVWYDNGEYKGGSFPESISKADFTYIGSKANEKKNYDPIVNVSFEGDRQRTYTIVHELTAFPGERVDLYPYSDLHMSKNYKDAENRDQYQEDFIRWYDYITDKRCDNLMFLQDPRYVYSTPFGHIGGSFFFSKDLRSPIAVASFVAPAEGLKEEGVYIAADFSMNFNTKHEERIRKNENKIVEPVIMYRHVFHISPARPAATAFNGGEEGINNDEYTRKHRRILSARANAMFTIRLDHPMPANDTNKEAGKLSETDIVFMGEGGNFAIDGMNYGRVREYGILVYDYANDTKGAQIPNDGDNAIFVPYQRSSYTSLTGMADRSRINEFSDDGKEVYWVADQLKYFRAIRCEAEKAEAGKKYLVQIVGKDRNGNYINRAGRKAGTAVPEKPLIIQEYVVEFLPDTKASFLTEDVYNSDDKYETHREEFLENLAGDENKKVVNFDEYNDLYDMLGGSFVAVNDDKGRLVKLPIDFAQCNYGSSYNLGGDYNIYKLIDHSSQAPFRHALEGIPGGVYDRLYYNTSNTGSQRRGFMYYVNAASDPGEIVSIPIERLCSGTTIYVSAWINEFTDTNPETANVIFNFRAKVNKYDKQGNFIETVDKATLHGFTSGYVKRTSKEGDRFIANDDFPEKSPDDVYKGGDQGKWMHIYYSFVPDISPLSGSMPKDEDNYSYKLEYELVLENNCISSKGADYVIDDIRMYLVPPRVEARQVKPICNLDEAKNVSIKINMPFESLLQANGFTEITDAGSEGKEEFMQYAILNKTVYDGYLAAHPEDDDRYVKAFAEAVLHYPHRHNVGEVKADNNLSWGTLRFNTKYEENPEFDYKIIDDPDNPEVDHNIGQAKHEEIDGERNIVFISTPTISNISDNPEYIIVVANFAGTGIFENSNKFNAEVYDTAEASKQREYDEKLGVMFDLENCARKVPFKISGPAQIIVDGYYQTDGDNIVCCENQRPVVQVNLYGSTDGNGGGLAVPDNELAQSPYIDWYHGKYSEFSEEKMNDDKSLLQVLADFRDAYPTADTWDMPAKNPYTEEERLYLKGLCEGTPPSDGVEAREPVLFLYQSSFVFPQTKKPTVSEEDKDKKDSDCVYVTAIPLQIEGTSLDKDLYLCTSPTEVKIHVTNTSPSMFNGFASGIKYPSEDVALRIGLRQLEGVSGEVDYEENPKGTNYWSDGGEGVYTLYMPLRDVSPATRGVNQLQSRRNNPYVYLAATNDPAYRQVGEQPGVSVTGEGGDTSVAATFPGVLQATKYDPLRLVMVSDPGKNRIDGENIGNTQTGDIFVYRVNVTRKGRYRVKMNYAKGGQYATSTAAVSLSAGNGNTIGMSGIPVTELNNWGAYREVTFADEIEINNEGPCDLTLKIVTAALNIKSFTFDWVGYDGYEADFGMKVAGELVDVKAPAGKGVTPMAKVRFYKNKITFREGYYYKFKFAFEEDYNGLNLGEDFTEPCNGETVFTVKVVPEYQKWTGGVENDAVNWNNDRNWRRVKAEEVLLPDVHDKQAFVTDGTVNGETVNETLSSYAPMDFTKVIIPAGAVYPQLAGRSHDRVGNDGSVSIDNGKNGSQTFAWSADAPSASEIEGEAGDTDATKDIQYDMASVKYEGDNNVYCRPWYANSCGQIHFETNAEIYRQQYLDYNKAWVDMEMKPARWYAASSPLRDVVAGDMYLPTDGARQNTELFMPMTFDKRIHDRFRPAVYQRGWDKGTANLYDLPANSSSEISNVAVTLDWSEVYNDAQERYTAGLGYSVKTDVSEIRGDARPEYVKFRLPKDDTDYDYWTYQGDESGNENGHPVTRENAGRLNEVGTEFTVDLKNVSGKYYLAGNPFMAHIDMAKFLKANEDVVEQKYWLYEAETGSQESNMIKPGTDFFIDNSGVVSEYGLLAPMQGFFLEKKGEGTKDAESAVLTLKFTPEMMTVQPWDSENGVILRSKTRGGDVPAGMTITANGRESRALLMLSEDASAGYVSAEDAVILADRESERAQVYTIGGNRALSINATPDAEGTEIGVLAGDNEETTLRFDNVSEFGHLSLLDSETGELTPLCEGMEYSVRGNASGRLFLTASVEKPELTGLAVSVEGRDVTARVPNATTGVDLYLYDTAGIMVASASGCVREARVSGLERGIYIVVASASDGSKKRMKILIQ